MEHDHSPKSCRLLLILAGFRVQGEGFNIAPRLGIAPRLTRALYIIAPRPGTTWANLGKKSCVHD